jgi:hypothetical protein
MNGIHSRVLGLGPEIAFINIESSQKRVNNWN